MEAVMPTVSIDEYPTLELSVAKKVFFENVIINQWDDNVRRLVAKVYSWNSGSGKNRDDMDQAEYKIFVPENWDDDYDLVLSLGTDGKTYPLYDCDTEAQMQWASATGLKVTPSQSNWAAWDTGWTGTAGTVWSEFEKLLKKVGNEGYWIMNSGKGWAGLRPPWTSKNGVGNERWKHRDLWQWFNWENLDRYIAEAQGPPPPPPGVTLEDLFGDDE